ncbi:hypothetical protein [Acinetobacter rathckeae]|uniref:hypothetical protein n=1 Tax=Acinetobacter rathckeae TaxID=2605272 RepID=UPI0018A2AFB8|nr:hypothetical protein [Acinetobacter rathckeae]MBF7694546.1 hypothetical protein [Acinetobacter rathckeae]
MARAKPTGRNKKPPHNACEIIEDMASNGYSKRNIAKALGVSWDLYVVWLEQYPELLEAEKLGKDKEHKALHNALYKSAMDGNVTASIFLLKTRHGYREGDQSDSANKVSITFQLPAASNSIDDYMKTVGSNRALLGGSDE